MRRPNPNSFALACAVTVTRRKKMRVLLSLPDISVLSPWELTNPNPLSPSPSPPSLCVVAATHDALSRVKEENAAAVKEEYEAIVKEENAAAVKEEYAATLKEEYATAVKDEYKSANVSETPKGRLIWLSILIFLRNMVNVQNLTMKFTCTGLVDLGDLDTKCLLSLCDGLTTWHAPIYGNTICLFRTPTNNPALDYQTADSEHVLKRSGPFGIPEDVNNILINILARAMLMPCMLFMIYPKQWRCLS